MPWLVTTGTPIIWAPGFLLAFVWLSLGVGRRCLVWLGASGGSLPERGIIALALGSGALQLVPFLLGAAGLLNVRSLWLGLGLVALLVSPDLARVAKIASRARGFKLALDKNLGWLCLALLPGLLAAGLLALTPTLDADGLGYHLTVPKRWLTSGHLAYLPTYPNSNMTMGVEMLFAIALSAAGDAAAKLLHFTLGVSGAVGLYFAGRRLSGPVLGATAVALYLFGPVGVANLLGWAYLEGATSLASIAATLAWIIWFQGRQSGWLRCAFALAGVGVSFKITAGLFPVGLSALTLVCWWNDRRQARSESKPESRLPWLSLLVLSIAPVTPWLARSAIVTGNPFFPLFARLLPSRDFSPEQAGQWEHFNRYLNWAIRVGASWSLERRQLILVGVGALFAGVAGVIWLKQRTWLARAMTIALLVIALLQLGAVGLYIRYWIPVMSVFQLPLLLQLPRIMARRTFQVVLVGATALASLSQARRSLTNRTTPTDVLTTAFGLQPQHEFLHKTMPLMPLYDQVNQTLPVRTGVLLAAYCGGFYLDRSTFCADIVQGSLRFTTFAEFSADLQRLGITHVLAPRAMAAGEMQPDEAAGVGFMIHEQECELVGKLLREQATLLGAAADQGLYELKPRNPQ